MLGIVNKKVLIFDDDEDVLSICSIVLEDAGWEVITFPNCNNIVSRVIDLNPAVILMDNWIPDEGGVVATQLLKKSADVNHIPVIYFSANNEVNELAAQAGADAYLAKPFDLGDLEAIVAKTAASSRSHSVNQ